MRSDGDVGRAATTAAAAFGATGHRRPGRARLWSDGSVTPSAGPVGGGVCAGRAAWTRAKTTAAAARDGKLHGKSFARRRAIARISGGNGGACTACLVFIRSCRCRVRIPVARWWLLANGCLERPCCGGVVGRWGPSPPQYAV